MIDPTKSKLAKRVTGPAGFWAAALAVDGERLYCGATDFAIYAYDARALPDQPAAVLKGHRSYVTALAFAPPARCLISGGLDRQVIGWKAGAETPTWTAPAGALINRLALSPNGEQVASAQDDLTVRIWEAATGKAVRQLAGEHVSTTRIGRASTLYSVAFSPDGRWLASGDRVGGVCVREVESGKLVHRLDANALYSQAFFNNPLGPNISSEYEWGGARSLAFSPDGKLLFAGGMGPADQNSAGLDGLMKIETFSLETGKPVTGVLLEKSKGVLHALAVHPEGRWLAAAGGGGGAGAGGSGTLAFWDYAARGDDGKPTPPLLFASAMVIRDLAFTADGARALAVGMEKAVTAGRIEAWDLGSPGPAAQPPAAPSG
jgi:WD40 repeat protein